MPSPVRIAILGAGLFAKEAYIPALSAPSGSEPAPILKAIYSRSEKTARHLHTIAVQSIPSLSSSPPAVYHDSDPSSNLDVLLSRSDIDAVIIVLPIPLQPSIILKALAAGKHVLSEKPAAPDVEQGVELIKAYRELYQPKGLVWRVAENWEAEPAYRAAADVVRRRKIGEVVQFRAIGEFPVPVDSKYYKTQWRAMPDYQGGFLLDGGVHTIAALRTILPSPVTHLVGFASLFKDYLAPYDSIHTIVQAGPKIRGTTQLSFSWPTQTESPSTGYIFTGTNGWLSISPVKLPSGELVLRLKVVYRDEAGESGEEKEEIVDEPLRGVELELASFVDRVVGKQTLDVGDPVGALRDVAFIEAALKSDGKLVDVYNLLPEGL